MELVESIQKIMKDTGATVSLNPSFDECGYQKLVKSCLYFYIPFDKSQTKIKNLLTNYAKKEKLEIVASITEFCDESECHGHYVDPFEPGNKRYVSIGKLPKNLSGSYVYFLTSKNMKILKLIREK